MLWVLNLLSILVSVIGLIIRRPALLVVGAVLAAPVSLYVGLMPRFYLVGFLLPVPQLLAAPLIKQGKMGLACAMLLPLSFFLIWLAAAVTNQ